MKNELRKNFLEIRKTLNTEKLSKKIIYNLYSLEEYKISKNILCYYPLKYEVNTCDLFKDLSKTWYLPRVNGLELEICEYHENELKLGSFNIIEPTGRKISDLSSLDMIIVPAVGADRNGYRLGRGKGYYDRFINSLKYRTNIVFLVYSNLLSDTIYPESFDKKCNFIISDKEILRIDC